MEKILIDQHGRYGDILFTLPIVKRLKEKGYKPFFAIHPCFFSIKKHFPEVNFLDYPNGELKEPHIVLPLWYAKYIDNNPNNLMSNKYKMYNVAIGDNIDENTYWRENLEPKRFKDKEKELMELLEIKEEDKYILINENHSYSNRIKIEVNTEFKKIYMEKIEGYSLIDWSSVIENAKEIHTPATSLLYLVEILDTTDKLFIYKREKENVKLDKLFNKKWRKIK